MHNWSPKTAARQTPYRVLLKRGEFTDLSRDARSVPYKIYHPEGADLTNSPIILWSHGFGGNRDGASFLSRYLAGQGYTLVHITHLGTDSSLWEGKPGHPWDILRNAKITRETTVNRMLDIPFVLDQLPIWAKENPEIGNIMDFSKIGMSGHSFGAMTTQTMAGMKFPTLSDELTLLRDERLTCGIAYSPVPIDHLTDAPHSEVYGSINIPLFHMTGTQDESPLEGYGYEHRFLVRDHANHPEQYTQVLEGGDHMVYNGTRGKLANNPLREQHEEEIIHASHAFWDAYLKDDESALQWLKKHYK